MAPQIRRYTDNAKAANTRKAYRIDWDDFVGSCALHDRTAMPAAPEIVAEYLVQLADADATVATIQRRRSSISVAHQVCGHEHDNPARSGLVTTTLQGIRRTLGTAQVQKAPEQDRSGRRPRRPARCALRAWLAISGITTNHGPGAGSTGSRQQLADSSRSTP